MTSDLWFFAVFGDGVAGTVEFMGLGVAYL